MGIKTVAVAAGGCALNGLVALLLFAPTASAEPEAPAPLPPPLPAPAAPADPAPTPTAPDAVAVAAPAPVDAPPAEGIPHLASPDALPPGSTMDPSARGPEGPNTGYLKDLWHAVQNQEISGKEAVIMGLAQRGMNTPYPEQAPGPNVPLNPGGANVPPPAVGAPQLPAPAPLPSSPPTP